MLSATATTQRARILKSGSSVCQNPLGTPIKAGMSEGGTFYISAPSLPCYAERKTYR
jgi:hypothetical protein